MNMIYSDLEYMDIIEKIKIFRRVTETRSFSAVAKELDLTQPTISKAIRSLEVELSLNLFRRSTRGLSLTVEGQKLYNSGGDLVDHFERVVSEVRNQKLNLAGEIRISASLAFARIVLAPLLAEFANKHPELRLTFLLSDGFVDLIEHNVDVAIRLGSLPDSTLRAVKIGNMRRALYASKGYLKKHGRPKTVADLRSHKLLLHTRHSDRPQWSLLNKKGEAERFVFEPYLKTDGSDLMREAILEGLGIAMMPTYVMAQPEKDKIVERLFDEAVDTPFNVFAVTPPGRELTSKQRALIDFLREKIEKIPSLSMR